ncbi:unnamed protein product [Kuraishia capsulata CBS 1993]|uniref:Inosine/uridine-preferring nucleoside hydrolase domain-containing protein n=1 Tax=Kuraishia capsulata CBS 1993 TaxID=1382522 RepID=W6MST3_9ASCO|nr:uncharacterized protein KUCA_T00005772001 [Kuraishia capsulata CBS 1993]CDK29779.1 unnamed protein product [Kuraishia capsulata CBS 1993]
MTVASPTRNAIIDCDPGIDDSTALLLALAPGNLNVRAITTVSGNLIASRCTENVKKILTMVERTDVPLGQGPEKPLVRPYPRDPFFHGDDGMADLDMEELKMENKYTQDIHNATDLIIDTANKYQGDITFVALGPLTNLALALIKDPSLPQKIGKVIIIGGSFGFNICEGLHATGDNPVSEWNIYVDPEAAEIVFNAGFDLTAIGMDIFCQPSIAMTPESHNQLLASSSVAAKFVTGVLAFLRKRGHGDYCALIDSLAVALAIDASIMETEEVSVAVETQSTLSLGQVIVDRRKNFKWTHLPTIQAAKTVDGAKYLKLLVGSFQDSE